MNGSLHVAQRPHWICRACQQPWPCQPARGRLLAEYLDTPASLGLYLGALFQEARHGQRPERVAELYDQLFGWLPTGRHGA